MEEHQHADIAASGRQHILPNNFVKQFCSSVRDAQLVFAFKVVVFGVQLVLLHTKWAIWDANLELCVRILCFNLFSFMIFHEIYQKLHF